MLKIATLMVVAAVAGSSEPEVLKKGFGSLLECNNYAINMLAERDAWCVALDGNGEPFEFVQRDVTYVYPRVEREPRLELELRVRQ